MFEVPSILNTIFCTFFEIERTSRLAVMFSFQSPREPEAIPTSNANAILGVAAIKGLSPTVPVICFETLEGTVPTSKNLQSMRIFRTGSGPTPFDRDNLRRDRCASCFVLGIPVYHNVLPCIFPLCVWAPIVFLPLLRDGSSPPFAPGRVFASWGSSFVFPNHAVLVAVFNLVSRNLPLASLHFLQTNHLAGIESARYEAQPLRVPRVARASSRIHPTVVPPTITWKANARLTNWDSPGNFFPLPASRVSLASLVMRGWSGKKPG